MTSSRNSHGSVQEVVELCRKSPGKISFGSSGTGSVQHLAAEMFNMAAGVKSIHVPYKGSGPMQTDLIGGQIDFSFDTMTAATAQVRAGKMLGIAQTRVNRAKGFPAMPTMDEQGFKGFDASSWYGVVGTRDMSRNWPSASMPTSTACWPCPTWSAASTDTAWRTVAAPWTSSRPSWLPNTGSGATWCALQKSPKKAEDPA